MHRSCDVAAALLAERAHRPAFEREALAGLLSQLAQSGSLDREAVKWTLEELGVAARLAPAGGPTV